MLYCISKILEIYQQFIKSLRNEVASQVFGLRVCIDSITKIAELEVEKEKMKNKVDKIVKPACNMFINRQLICKYPEQLFANDGVMSIKDADFDGIERLALVTSGEIVSSFNNPDLVKLGRCVLNSL